MAQSDLAGPIGRPLDRVDGPLKVTGRAKYAFEYAAQGEAAYGFIVSAAIGRGRVIGVDVRDAERAPGVLLVLTQDNAPPQTPWGPVHLPDRFARACSKVSATTKATGKPKKRTRSVSSAGSARANRSGRSTGPQGV